MVRSLALRMRDGEATHDLSAGSPARRCERVGLRPNAGILAGALLVAACSVSTSDGASAPDGSTPSGREDLEAGVDAGASDASTAPDVAATVDAGSPEGGPSSCGTTVPPAAAIVDEGGAVWTLSGEKILRNGVVDPVTAGVILLLWQGQTLYQETSFTNDAGANLWWSWTGTTGSAPVTGDPRLDPAACATAEAGAPDGDASATCTPAPNCSTAGVQLIPGDNLQNAIDANPAGTTFILPAGTWHGQNILGVKSNDHFIGDCNGGTVLTGDDTTQVLFSQPNGETGVVFENITVEHYDTSTPECYLGAIHGASWTFVNDVFQFNNCSGLVLGTGAHVIGGHYNDNLHSGLAGGGNAIVERAEIARNNARHDNVDNDAAGFKGCASGNQVLNNYVHDNYAMGLWCDCRNTGWTVQGNTVVRNLGNGIQYETCLNGTISGNVFNDNGRGGILSSSSGATQIYGNNVRVPATGGDAIIVQADPRSDAEPSDNDVVHDKCHHLFGQ